MPISRFGSPYSLVSHCHYVSKHFGWLGTYARIRLASECLIGADVDVKRIGIWIAAALIRRYVRLAEVESRLARARVDDGHGDGITHATDVGTAISALVRHLPASTTVAGGTAWTLISRDRLLPIALACIDRPATLATADVGTGIPSSGAVAAIAPRLWAADSVALGAVVVECGHAAER